MSSCRYSGASLLIGTLLLASCATTAPPDYPPNHPANPNAATAPAAPFLSTLSSYRPARELAHEQGASEDGKQQEHEHGGGHADH